MAAPPPPPPLSNDDDSTISSTRTSTSSSSRIGALAVAALGGAGPPVVTALAVSGALSPRFLLLELPRVARPIAAAVLATTVRAPTFARRHVAAFLAAAMATAAATTAAERPVIESGDDPAGEDPAGGALVAWRRVPARGREGLGKSRDPVLRTVEAVLWEQPWDRLPASYWAGLSSVLGLDARLMSLFLGGEPARTSCDAVTVCLTRTVRRRRAKFAAALRGIAELAAGTVSNSAATIVDFWMEGGGNIGGVGAVGRSGPSISSAVRAEGPCPVNYSAVVAILDDVELLRDVEATLRRKGLGLDLEAAAEFAARSSATRVLGYLSTEYHDTVARCADDLVAIAVFRNSAELLPVLEGLPFQADRRSLRLEAVTTSTSYDNVTWDMRNAVLGRGPSSACVDVLMFFAALHGNAAAVAFLLERAATLPHSPRWLDLPLFVAAGIGRTAVVAALLDAGADARFEWNQERPLNRAATYGDCDTVDALLAHGALLEEIGRDGRTPLEHAVIMGNLELTFHLLEKGASVATRPGKPSLVYHAVERNYLALAHLLVDHGADFDGAPPGTASWSRTPLTVAIQNENQQLIGYLLEKGGDAAHPDQALQAAAGVGDTTTARRLLERGARPVALHVADEATAAAAPATAATYFPIHAACRNGHPEMLALLLNWVRRAAGPQARQSEDSQDAGGRASSDIAAAEAAAAVAAAIAQRNPQGRTPLHEAASADAAECVSALLARGADVEAVATPGAIDGGMRPLHLAASAGAVEAVRLLVAAGAAVDARDGKGRTPRMVAEAARNTAVVALMDDAMAETTTAAAPS